MFVGDIIYRSFFIIITKKSDPGDVEYNSQSLVIWCGAV